MNGMRIGLGIAALLAGLQSWNFPGWNGFFVAASDVSVGDGRIIGAIFFAVALVLFGMVSPNQK